MLYSFTVENLIVFSYRLFILGATGLLVAGCGGGDPGVSYRGISAENAITLLSKAEGQEEQLAVLKAVESDAQFGFDWLYFWESVRNQNLEAGLEAAADDFLFHLGEKFCESTSFDAYAQVVLRRPSHYPRIVQPSRSCSFALNADTLMKYFTVLSSGEISEELGDRYLVELLSSYSQKVPSHQMQEILNQRTERQWAELLHRLVHGEQADLALQLLSVHQKIFGVVHFLELMTAPILASPQLLEKFTEALGLNFVLRLLTTSPERVSVVPEILQAHWESSMAYLARVYAASPPPSEEDMSWDTYLAELYAQYKSTALLLNHLRLKVPASFLLQIEEVLLRKLEAALRSHEEAAKRFLAESVDTPAIYWLRLRTGHVVQLEDVEHFFDEALALNLTESITLKRLEIHLAPEAEWRRQLVLEFCDDLESLGIERSEAAVLPSGDLEWGALTQAGCFDLQDGSSGSVLHSENVQVRMSFNSVLLTHGTSLVIKADDFDGSIIDLSATFKHRDLPEEPPALEDGAIVFPALLGFRLPENFVEMDAEIYYLVYFYTYKPATPGKASEVIPLRGEPGGDLWVETQSPRASFSPAAVSLGGDGQKAAPRRKGGHADSSYYNAKRASDIIGAATDAYNRPRHLLRGLIPSEVQWLLDVAQTDKDGLIDLYTEPSLWWSLLEETDKVKLSKICGAAVLTEECASQLALGAARQMKEQVATARLYSEYTEPEGPKGPLNPDGLPGSDGLIEFFGFENE